MVDWRRRISPLLTRHLLRLVARKATEQGAPTAESQPPSTAPSATTATTGTQPHNNPAVASIASLLRNTGQQLATQSLAQFIDSAAFNNSRCVRLLVFATSMYSWKVQPVEFEVHECNSIYLHRRGLKPTVLERLLLVKTALLDSSLTKPGWFWTVRWNTPISRWLPWFIRFDKDENARVRALNFADQINFPLVGQSTGRAVYAALDDASVSVRLAALRYLASHGRAPAIRHLRQLQTESDPAIRNAATSTVFSIRMRANPDREFRRILTVAPTLTDMLLTAVDLNISRASVGVLLRYTDHSNSTLRLKVVSELQRRKELPLPAALQLVSDDSRLVREKVFYILIDHGAAPGPTEIRAQLAEHPTSLFSGFGQAPDPDAVISYYFDKQPQEKLWQHVKLMDVNSSLAMRAIGQRFLAHGANAIRDSLVEDFSSDVAAAKLRRDQSILPNYFHIFGGDPIETARRNVRAAALAALATRPEAADRLLFKRFLSSELSATDQTIACLRGLSHVGTKEDKADIEPFLSSASASVQTAAARTWLLLSSDRTATVKELLTKPAPPTVFVVVASSLSNRVAPIWDELKPLLSNQDDDIRRLACHYATTMLGRRKLHALLNEYPKSGFYYYNVVTLLDRALYTVGNVRRYLRQQEVAHFAKLSGEVNRGWPGLSL